MTVKDGVNPNSTNQSNLDEFEPERKSKFSIKVVVKMITLFIALVITAYYIFENIELVGTEKSRH